jgi:hypothetical protein
LKIAIRIAEMELVLQALQNELFAVKEKLEGARMATKHHKINGKKTLQELLSTKRKLEAILKEQEEQEESRKRRRLSYFI